MPKSREVVLIDAPDLVDDYLSVRLSTVGRVARVTSHAFDDAARLEELLDRTTVTDLVAWLPDGADDALVRRAVSAMLPGVVATNGAVVVLSGTTALEERTEWFRELQDDHPSAHVRVVRHDPVAGAFWDCRGELQTLETLGCVPLSRLATAVAEAMTDGDAGYREITLSATQEMA